MTDAPLAYTSLGFRVFPVVPRAKYPLTKNGLKDASADPATITRWQELHPGCNWGLLAPEDGLVLDCDTRAAADDLLARYRELREAPRCRSPRDGAHLFVRKPEGTPHISARSGALPSVDVRGLGRAYTLAPPSHTQHGAYSWEVPLVPIAELPLASDELIALLTRPKHSATIPTEPVMPQDADHARRYGLAALWRERGTVGQAPEGQRNHALNAAAFALGQLIAAGALDRSEVEDALLEAAALCGLPPGEAKRTIDSGISAGLEEPRTIPDPDESNKRASFTTTSRPEEPDDWPEEPGELPAVTPPAPTLPAIMIPEPFRAWIMDAAERICVHPEFIAVPALSAAGSLVGRKVGVRPKRFDDYIEFPLLWGAIVGNPSTRKSPALNEGLRHLKRLAAEAREQYEAEELDRAADKEVLEIELKQVRSAAGKQKKDPTDYRDRIKELREQLREADPPCRRYDTQDATVEKLVELLNENPNGLLNWRDELMAWLKSLERPGRESDRAFYLEAWSCKQYHGTDRIGRGSLYVPALVLTILGGIQPGPLASYIAGAIAGDIQADGMLQRFQLIVYPDEPRPWVNVDRYPDAQARDRAYTIFHKLDALKPDDIGAEAEAFDDTPGLRFDEEAQGLYNDWIDGLMARVQSPDLHQCPAYQAHLAKYPSLVARLALLFHLIDVADGNAYGPVSADAVTLAINWCEFLGHHARKIYGAELNSDARAARELDKRIESGQVADGMRVRDIARRDWGGLDSSETVTRAAGVLDGVGRARLQSTSPADKGGRPSQVIRIHPKLREAP